MKKIISVMIFLISFAAMANDISHNNRVRIRSEILNNRYKEFGTIYADIVDADIYLELLNDSKQNLSKNNLILVFPDIKILNDNVFDLSKRLKKIKIYLLENKSKAYKMDNRSYEELKDMKYNTEIEKIENVEIIKIKASDKEIKNAYLDSNIIMILDNSMYKSLGINLEEKYE